MQQLRPVRRALLSVSDKAGIVEFARALSQRGVDLLSTGGTARLLADAGLPVTEVSDYTGFPEMMDGRVKTLHPKVHGGILGRRGQDDDIFDATFDFDKAFSIHLRNVTRMHPTCGINYFTGFFFFTPIACHYRVTSDA